MEAGQRAQLVEMAEQWSIEHFEQPWARVMHIEETTDPVTTDAATYHVSVEIPDYPDWQHLTITLSPTGQTVVEYLQDVVE